MTRPTETNMEEFSLYRPSEMPNDRPTVLTFGRDTEYHQPPSSFNERPTLAQVDVPTAGKVEDDEEIVEKGEEAPRNGNQLIVNFGALVCTGEDSVQ